MGGVLGEPAIFQAHASCFLEFQIQISLCGCAAFSECPPSFRLGHRKTSDSNRAVNGAKSRPEHGVITITITIMITIMM